MTFGCKVKDMGDIRKFATYKTPFFRDGPIT
jgi:hypothetical protein